MAVVTVDISPFLVRSAGVKTYLYYWLKALRTANHPNLEIRTFPADYRGEALIHEGSVFSAGATFLALARFAMLTRAGLSSAAGDIYHATNLSYRTPHARRITTTLHDVTYRMFPDLHTAATRECHRRFDENVLVKCSRIMCVSEATRRDAVRVLGIPEERLTVIHPGVDSRFFSVSESDRRRAREALQLPSAYALFLSTIEPRKNLDRILDAYSQLPNDVQDQYPLVVAGAEGWNAGQTIARMRTLAPRVRYLSYIDEQWIPALTAEASLFVYPSLYEGFGFPLAQALAAGVPSITSHVSSMPEVAGEGAFLVDPEDTTSLRDSILRLLTSDGERARLAALAALRGRDLTWERNAAESVQFFLDVAAF